VLPTVAAKVESVPAVKVEAAAVADLARTVPVLPAAVSPAAASPAAASPAVASPAAASPAAASPAAASLAAASPAAASPTAVLPAVALPAAAAQAASSSGSAAAESVKSPDAAGLTAREVAPLAAHSATETADSKLEEDYSVEEDFVIAENSTTHDAIKSNVQYDVAKNFFERMQALFPTA
jgi:hypothetical protein